MRSSRLLRVEWKFRPPIVLGSGKAEVNDLKAEELKEEPKVPEELKVPGTKGES